MLADIVSMALLIFSGLVSYLAIFYIGASIGSFIAVAVERIPQKRSILEPSTCACGRTLTRWENVPIVGYLRIKGVAKCCGAKLPKFYFLFEIFSGLLAITVFTYFMFMV